MDVNNHLILSAALTFPDQGTRTRTVPDPPYSLPILHRGQIMQCVQGQTHHLPKRGGRTLTTNAEERLCSHRPDKNKRGAGILRVPSLFTPPALSPQENPDYFPVLAAPAPTAACAAESRRKGRAWPFPLQMAQPRLLLRFSPPKHQFSRNQEALCNSGGEGWGVGSSNQPGLRAGARRCNQSSHLKVASPLS